MNKRKNETEIEELTYEQEDLILESGLEKWRENRK